MPLDAEWVADQARCVLEDMPVAAFKIGLLGSIENISAIAEVVSDYPEIPLVLDPVLASGRGDELVTDEMITAVRELLIPQTTIITPNSIEARRLVQEDGEDDLDLAECARRLLDDGLRIRADHRHARKHAQVVNTLYGQDGVVRSDSWDRLPGSYHGSGCTLASAIAATIANGLSISDAVKDAQEYTWQTLKSAFRPGMGQHIPDRLFWAREDEPATDCRADLKASTRSRPMWPTPRCCWPSRNGARRRCAPAAISEQERRRGQARRAGPRAARSVPAPRGHAYHQ